MRQTIKKKLKKKNKKNVIHTMKVNYDKAIQVNNVLKVNIKGW